MRFFVVVTFAAAFLLAAVSARGVGYERTMRLLRKNEEKNHLRQGMLFALGVSLAENTGTCKTCWKYFGVISKHMQMSSSIKPTDDMVRLFCQALRIYDVDGDCVPFIKATYSNLTAYVSDQLDPSKICPTALHCKPTEEDKAVMALDEEFNLCTVCKTAGKMLVNIVKEYYKQGTAELREKLLGYCQKVSFAPLRTMCRAGVNVLVDHIPEILKGGASEVCKLLGACK